jgi:hypothetical protein
MNPTLTLAPQLQRLLQVAEQNREIETVMDMVERLTPRVRPHSLQPLEFFIDHEDLIRAMRIG